MAEPALTPLKIVVLTALPVEFQAVREHISDIHEEVHPAGTIYKCGTFMVPAGNWDVALAQVGAGNPGAAFEAERAIQYFQPQMVLFVGVAGGLKEKDVRLGDVVAATKIYGYEFGKASKRFQPRPEVGLVSYAMEQRARAEACEDEWRRRIKGSGASRSPAEAGGPHVLVGPIAAGEKVLKSRSVELAALLRATYDDALAIEMEGYGFLKAVHAHHSIQALVVRGISDLIEGKDEADAQNWQEIASRHASAFAFEILAKSTPHEAARLPESIPQEKQVQPVVQSGESDTYKIQFHGPVQNVAIGEQSQIINH